MAAMRLRRHSTVAVLLSSALGCSDGPDDTAPLSETSPQLDEVPIEADQERGDGGVMPGPRDGATMAQHECERGSSRPCGSGACTGTQVCVSAPQGGSSWSVCDLAAAFVDGRLESSIRNQLEISEGPLSEPALSQLTSLSAAGLGISALDGIQCMPALERADLYGNSISDLAPLAGLTALASLTLQSNSIAEIGPLAQLTRLEGLTLNNNAIVNLEPLAGMAVLEVLTSSDNQISDLSPLASLSQLILLDLSRNAISDLTPLAALPNLVQVDLASNQIVSLEPLLSMATLDRLFVAGNPLDCDAPSVASLRERLSVFSSDCRVQ